MRQYIISGILAYIRKLNRENNMKDYQMRAIKKYQDAHYEFIKVRLNKGEKDVLKERATKEGKSLNEYIRERIL